MIEEANLSAGSRGDDYFLVRDGLAVVTVAVGRELLLDAAQLLLRQGTASDRGAIGQQVDDRKEGVAQACRPEHISVVGNVGSERHGDRLDERAICHGQTDRRRAIVGGDAHGLDQFLVIAAQR